MFSLTTWEQKPYIPTANAKVFTAKVHLTGGKVIGLERKLK